MDVLDNENDGDHRPLTAETLREAYHSVRVSMPHARTIKRNVRVLGSWVTLFAFLYSICTDGCAKKGVR